MASSSTISVSRSAGAASGGSRRRINARQSISRLEKSDLCLLCPGVCGHLRGPDLGDLIQRVDELAPYPAAGAQHLAPGGGQAIKTAAPLAGLFDPAARDPALFLELVEQGIKRRGLETELAARPGLDNLGQLITMPIGTVEDRQHQELGTALLQRACGDI